MCRIEAEHLVGSGADLRRGSKRWVGVIREADKSWATIFPVSRDLKLLQQAARWMPKRGIPSCTMPRLVRMESVTTVNGRTEEGDVLLHRDGDGVDAVYGSVSASQRGMSVLQWRGRNFSISSAFNFPVQSTSYRLDRKEHSFFDAGRQRQCVLQDRQAPRCPWTASRLQPNVKTGSKAGV